MMNECDRKILKEFSARVREQFPEAQIWAFGSRARGDAQPDSDLDICVVIVSPDTPHPGIKMTGLKAYVP